jgi:outer membrane biosynthesis protein TonB
MRKIIAGAALITAAGLGLGACSTRTIVQPAPKPAVTVTKTAPAAKPKPKPAPKVTVTKQAPTKVIINNPPAAAPAPAQQAAPPADNAAMTACGTGTQGEEVYAGADTSCPFALNVESDYWAAPGLQFEAYSPVTNQTYLMNASPGVNSISVTGGNGALVTFAN